MATTTISMYEGDVIATALFRPISTPTGVCRQYRLETTSDSTSNIDITVRYTNCDDNSIHPNESITLEQINPGTFTTYLCSKTLPRVINDQYSTAVSDVGDCGTAPQIFKVNYLVSPVEAATPFTSTTAENGKVVTAPTTPPTPNNGYRFLQWVPATQTVNGADITFIAIYTGAPSASTCQTKTVSMTCATYFNDTRYTGNATRIENVSPETPIGCITAQGIPTAWDTTSCVLNETVPVYTISTTVTPSAAYGTITYSGPTVGPSRNDTFTFTPSNGYRLKSWEFLKDGVRSISNPANIISSGMSITYTVDSNLLIVAQFEVIPPTPSPTSWRVCDTTITRQDNVPSDYLLTRDTRGICYRAPQVPHPTPTPTVIITWRDCISGILKEGNAPAGYREEPYSGAGGGTCWEPITVVGFSPSLSEALLFTYQRGSSNLPQPKTITATNPSYGTSYRVTITTNPDIIVTPSSFTIQPRSDQSFIVNVTPVLLGKLGDGTSTIQMSVDIQEI